MVTLEHHIVHPFRLQTLRHRYTPSRADVNLLPQSLETVLNHQACRQKWISWLHISSQDQAQNRSILWIDTNFSQVTRKPILYLVMRMAGVHLVAEDSDRSVLASLPVTPSQIVPRTIKHDSGQNRTELASGY